MEYPSQSKESLAISILASQSDFNRVLLTTHRLLMEPLTGIRAAHEEEVVEQRRADKAGPRTTGISFVTSRTAPSRKALWAKVSGSDPLDTSAYTSRRMQHRYEEHVGCLTLYCHLTYGTYDRVDGILRRLYKPPMGIHSALGREVALMRTSLSLQRNPLGQCHRSIEESGVDSPER